MSTLKLTLLQQPLVWLDAQANLRHFDMLLEPLRQRDVIVLPEMFTTGFAMNAAENALSEAEISNWLRHWAAQSNALIGGSVALTTSNGAVNRFLLAEPGGQIHHYDKRHLFRMAGEHHHYQAGSERKVVEWRGWRILPQVCYDLRFPVWSRNQQDYDLALYVANWPATRAKHWQTLLAARAIENQAYVAGCNRVGDDDNGHHYQGGSVILDAQGETLAQAEPGLAAQLDAELSLETLRAYREKFPAWRDVDHFQLL
ncbi:amidohydrolase [Yersinia pekkanenii]|uniref:Omega-amidase YafV n=1 Tax=Yersinia pekkanenii TaxID=1288385 RepID=A0A0T9R2C0_9GAMM|nr:amidohydrolase [Yersinia pekkanenii]CNI41018.1 putative hydrolase [Yersinia pekkanenii]CRY69050.1 putative hydrolase [Yersinia pekkanenii]